MLLFDAQTSGGMLICVPSELSQEVFNELKKYYEYSSIIGTVKDFDSNFLTIK
jgi:hydrogenase maturation factor